MDIHLFPYLGMLPLLPEEAFPASSWMSGDLTSCSGLLCRRIPSSWLRFDVRRGGTRRPVFSDGRPQATPQQTGVSGTSGNPERQPAAAMATT